jgi:hypothetical protein
MKVSAPSLLSPQPSFGSGERQHTLVTNWLRAAGSIKAAGRFVIAMHVGCWPTERDHQVIVVVDRGDLVQIFGDAVQNVFCAIWDKARTRCQARTITLAWDHLISHGFSEGI